MVGRSADVWVHWKLLKPGCSWRLGSHGRVASSWFSALRVLSALSLHLSPWLSSRQVDVNQRGPSPLCCGRLCRCSLASLIPVPPQDGFIPAVERCSGRSAAIPWNRAAHAGTPLLAARLAPLVSPRVADASLRGGLPRSPPGFFLAPDFIIGRGLAGRGCWDGAAVAVGVAWEPLSLLGED